MQIFKYSFLPKLIYRYANIPANIILLFYMIASILAVINNWKFIFPLMITLILLYVLNRFYIRMYKTFPFKIEADNEKMICSDFVINKRTVEIKHEDILKITGGIFSGRPYMPLYIETENEKLGISPHIKNYNKLLTIILSNIPKELYTSLLNSIKEIAINNKLKDKKNSKAND
ncbi:MAG: hypothetical protein CR986_00525 [Ignavibacteriae bacterium]|nr:MAG: hypothetical protein CR986_00525 [Ignavibacteriota bacterium]